MPEGRERERDRLSLPREVRDAEREYRKLRRGAAGTPPINEDESVVGLALSGGGIRSATFNLGVLQEMARSNTLRLVDYLSTVSGGGYIGSCLTSLLSRPSDPSTAQAGGQAPNPRRQPYLWPEGAVPKHSVGGPNMPFLERDEVHHLRKHGNFLILRGGALSRDVLRAVGGTLTGLVLTFSLFLSLLCAAASLVVAYLSALVPPEAWVVIAKDAWLGWAYALGYLVPAPGWRAWGVHAFFAGGGALIVVLLSAHAYNRPLKRRTATAGETPEERSERVRLWWYAGWLAGPPLVALVILASPSGRLPGRWSGLLFPVAFYLGARMTTVLIQALITVWTPRDVTQSRWTLSFRSVFGALQGIVFYFLAGFAALALVPFVLWLGGSAIVEYGGPGAAATLILSRLLARLKEEVPRAATRRSEMAAAVRGLALQLAVVVFVVLAVLLAVWTILWSAGFTVSWLTWLVWLGGAGSAFLLVGFFVNFNRISPHYFYRDRLAEAYLRTEARRRGVMTILRDDAEMHLMDLHGRKEAAPQGGGSETLVANPSPYHLIVSSLNLAGSRDLARRTRKSDHFIFSRLFCGSGTTGYVPTDVYRGGETKLARAMTIAGAAVSPARGEATSLATAFVMTLFNARLGYWMRNPGIYKKAIFAGDNRPSPEKLNRLQKRASWWNFYFWPAWLLREMTGATDADHRMVHLSDGGHTGDNVGICPLLHRRCQVVIACDAECDPAYSFGSLASAILQMNADENVQVDIDLDRLIPLGEAASEGGEGATSRKAGVHYAVGKICYLDAASGDSDPEAQVEDGWLIYLKSSLTGDEPAAVESYKATNPEFPQQTTADQFFDDAQFEAYRMLGAHIAKSFLTAAGGTVPEWRKWCEQEHRKASEARGSAPCGA